VENKAISNMISDITKQFEDGNIFDLSAHLINYYYHHFYQGSEHDSVTLMYFDYVNIELTIWLGQNSRYLKQDKKSIKKVQNFFQKEILKAKIKSHWTRVHIYHRWLSGDKYKDDLSEILQHMFKLYKSLDERNEVRKDLGLMISIKELENQLKQLE